MSTEDEKREPTEAELEVAFAAWALAARGNAFVPNETHLPACRSMEARGWLSSRTLDNGDAAYEWTPAGETALQTSGLLQSRLGDAN